jgi:hypothetical protein
MKRKIFNVLFALVLVLSFSLVTAAPAAATAPVYRDGIEFKVVGAATVLWSVANQAAGDYSAKLAVGTDPFETDWAKVYIYFPPVPLSDITNPTFLAKGVIEASVENLLEGESGGGIWNHGPYLNILLDTDGDGARDDALEGIIASSLDGYAVGWHTMEGTDYYDGDNSLGGDPTYTSEGDDAALSYWQALHPTYDVVGVGIALGYSSHTEDNQVVYIDDVTIGEDTYAMEPSVINNDTSEGFNTIQAAIDDADTLAGDTISVAAGTYSDTTNGETFPITVNKANLTIQSVSGAATTIITPTSADQSSFEVTAAGATIGGSGFTIGAGGRAGIYADVTGGNGITVQDCIFNSYSAGESRGMWFEKLWGGALITGNSFTTPRVGTGILVQNADGATISNNTATGTTVKYSFLTFKAEAFYPDRDGTTAYAAPYNEFVAEEASTINDVTITGNTISDMDADRCGIKFATSTKGHDHGEPQAQDLAVGSGGVSITNNTFTFTAASAGIAIDADEAADDDAEQIAHITGVGNILINQNSFSGTAGYGVYNEQTTTVNAEGNWWGSIAGPNIATNPYGEWTVDEPAATLLNGDYIPWLIQSELAEGWNIWSAPIAPDADSWAQLQAVLADADAIYYFDSVTQFWGADPDDAGLLDAWYIKMPEATTISYYFNSEATFPSQKAMKVGWNLIGLAQLHEEYASVALLDASWGTGSLITGYSRVMSPSLNGISWLYLNGQVGEPPLMFPTKGYWVFMVNDGVLGGFTSTPITEQEAS